MDKPTPKKPTKSDIAAVIASAGVSVLVLVWGMQSGNPYGYFVFLRIVVCLGAFVFAAIFSGKKREMLVILFAGIAILFNPVFPIHLTREKWLVLDAVTIVAFCAGAGVWLGAILKGRRASTGSANDA